MTNIDKTHSKRTTGITESQILDKVKNKYPVIFIREIEGQLEVADGHLRYGVVDINLIGKTVLEVVNELQSNGISAYITDNKVAMYPAILLLSFSSSSIEQFDINTSPFNLSTIHTSSAFNLPKIDQSYITRNVLSVSDSNRVYVDNLSSDHGYEVNGDKLLISKITPSLKVLIEYSISSFFLFAGDANIINVSKLIKDKDLEDLSSTEKDLIFELNRINKGII